MVASSSRKQQRHKRLVVDRQQDNKASQHELLSSCAHISKRDKMRTRSCIKRENDKGPKKSVRFATRKSKDRGKVHCSVKVFEKEDQALLDSLFWTQDELYETFDDERANVEQVEPIYSETLRAVYAQSSNASTSDVDIHVNFEDMALCSQARGLEHEILPLVRNFTKKHRRAVLLVQEKLRDADEDMEGDRCLELLRKASRKYSRPSRLVAMRMGEFDSVDSSDDDGDDSAAHAERGPRHSRNGLSRCEQSFFG